jgi:hypothetical protein
MFRPPRDTEWSRLDSATGGVISTTAKVFAACVVALVLSVALLGCTLPALLGAGTAADAGPPLTAQGQVQRSVRAANQYLTIAYRTVGQRLAAGTINASLGQRWLSRLDEANRLVDRSEQLAKLGDTSADVSLDKAVEILNQVERELRAREART